MMSEEERYPPVPLKSIRIESDAEASQTLASYTIKPENLKVPVFDTSSDNGFSEDISNGPIQLKYRSDPYIGSAPSFKLEPEGSRETLQVQFRDLLKTNYFHYWTCIGSRRFGGRCKIYIERKNILLAEELILRLRGNVSENVPSVKVLVELAELLLCKRFHQYQAAKIAMAWEKELSTSFRREEVAIDKDIRPIITSDKSLHFPRQQPNSIVSVIANAMRKPLSPLDTEGGFIFTVARPGIPSKIKIGSTLDVRRRLREYTKSYGFEPNLISQHFVHHRLRTEKLVFTSLMEQRREVHIYNEGKGGSWREREWFEIDDTLALLTIERWRAWMNLNPYSSNRLDAFWEINLFKAEQLLDQHAFHQWIEHMTQSCIQKGEDAWRGRSNGRFNESDDDELQPPSISPALSVASANTPGQFSGTTLESSLSDDQVTSSVEEFAAWLLKDEVIHSLQVVAVDRIGAERFERNFCRFLQMYSEDLRAEARTSSEIQAVQFVRSRRRNVAHCLRSQINPVRKEESQGFENLSKQEPAKDELLKRFGLAKSPLQMRILNDDFTNFESPIINSTMKDQNSDDIGPYEIGLGDIGLDDIVRVDNELDDNLGLDGNDLDDIEWDDSEQGEADKLSLPNLGLVKEFMITSEAFGKLRENLSGFVFPPGHHVLKDLAGTETKKLVRLSSAEESTTFVKPEVVEIGVNTVGLVTDLVDTNLASTSEKQNLTKVDNDAVVAEPKVFDGDSKASITGSAPITDPHTVDVTAKAVSQDCGELVVNRKPFWKFNNFLRASALKRWMKLRWSQALRPKVKHGYRRIEWICDCGENLYGDFDNSNPQAVSQLAAELQGSTSNELPSSRSQGGSKDAPQGVSNPTQSASTRNNEPMTNFTDNQLPPTTSTASAAAIPDPQYVGLCVNTSEFRISLAEVEMSDVVSDAELFDRLKSNYRSLRGFRTRFSFLIQPVAIRFVKFTLFGIRGGDVGLDELDKPWSIPPADVREYRYRPVPLESPPPVPSNVLLHFLKYGNTQDVHKTKFWAHKIPKRVKQRLIDVPDYPVSGWGIYIVEGPNRSGVFWITMSTVFASILAGVLWSSIRDDIQGGTGLGSMIIAFPPVIMAAFLFKFTAE